MGRTVPFPVQHPPYPRCTLPLRSIRLPQMSLTRKDNIWLRKLWQPKWRRRHSHQTRYDVHPISLLPITKYSINLVLWVNKLPRVRSRTRARSALVVEATLARDSKPTHFSLKVSTLITLRSRGEQIPHFKAAFTSCHRPCESSVE